MKCYFSNLQKKYNYFLKYYFPVINFLLMLTPDTIRTIISVLRCLLLNKFVYMVMLIY